MNTQSQQPEQEHTPMPELNEQPTGQPFKPEGDQPPRPPEEEKRSAGAVIGSIIIVLILIVGGLYLWSQTQIQEDQQQVESAESTTLPPSMETPQAPEGVPDNGENMDTIPSDEPMMDTNDTEESGDEEPMNDSEDNTDMIESEVEAEVETY